MLFSYAVPRAYGNKLKIGYGNKLKTELISFFQRLAQTVSQLLISGDEFK